MIRTLFHWRNCSFPLVVTTAWLVLTMGWLVCIQGVSRQYKRSVVEIEKLGGTLHYEHNYMQQSWLLPEDILQTPVARVSFVNADIDDLSMLVVFGSPLQQIEFFKCTLGSGSLTAINQLPPARYGNRILTIDSCRLPESTFSELKRCAFTILSCRNSNVTDVMLTQWPRTLNVQQLILTNTEVADLGLQCLYERAHLNQLVLSGTKVSDEGILKMPLNWGNRLTLLDLSKTKITDRSLQRLAKVSLKQLQLDQTEVTDEGLQYFRNSSLNTLSVHDTKVTTTGIGELQKLSPNLVVSYDPLSLKVR